MAELRQAVTVRLEELLGAPRLRKRQRLDRVLDLPATLALSQLCSVCQAVGFLEGIAMADRQMAEQILDQIDDVANLIEGITALPVGLSTHLANEHARKIPSKTVDRRELSKPVERERRVEERRQSLDRRVGNRRRLA